MKEILLLEPVFVEKIWGGSALSSYGYRIPDKRIGEAYGISARTGCDCKIRNSIANGAKLSEFYQAKRDWFGNSEFTEFPFSFKLISANNDSEVFVRTADNGFSSSNRVIKQGEFLYVLNSDEHASMIAGHKAVSREEASDSVRKGRLKLLTRDIPIRRGDFFRMDYGTVQGFRPGTVVLSICMEPCVTYRLSGNTRSEQNDFGREQQLALDAVSFPSSAPKSDFIYSYRLDSAIVKRVAASDGFLIEHMQMNGTALVQSSGKFSAFSVLCGNGTINGNGLQTGDSFIIPSGYGSISLTGDLQLIRCTITK